MPFHFLLEKVVVVVSSTTFRFGFRHTSATMSTSFHLPGHLNMSASVHMFGACGKLILRCYCFALGDGKGREARVKDPRRTSGIEVATVPITTRRSLFGWETLLAS